MFFVVWAAFGVNFATAFTAYHNFVEVKDLQGNRYSGCEGAIENAVTTLVTPSVQECADACEDEDEYFVFDVDGNNDYTCKRLNLAGSNCSFIRDSTSFLHLYKIRRAPATKYDTEYRLLTAGTCESEGLQYIYDEMECMAATVQLGVGSKREGGRTIGDPYMEFKRTDVLTDLDDVIPNLLGLRDYSDTKYPSRCFVDFGPYEGPVLNLLVNNTVGQRESHRMFSLCKGGNVSAAYIPTAWGRACGPKLVVPGAKTISDCYLASLTSEDFGSFMYNKVTDSCVVWVFAGSRVKCTPEEIDTTGYNSYIGSHSDAYSIYPVRYNNGTSSVCAFPIFSASECSDAAVTFELAPPSSDDRGLCSVHNDSNSISTRMAVGDTLTHYLCRKSSAVYTPAVVGMVCDEQHYDIELSLPLWGCYLVAIQTTAGSKYNTATGACWIDSNKAACEPTVPAVGWDYYNASSLHHEVYSLSHTTCAYPIMDADECRAAAAALELPPFTNSPGVPCALKYAPFAQDDYTRLLRSDWLFASDDDEKGGHTAPFICKTAQPAPTPGPTGNPTPGPTGNPSPEAEEQNYQIIGSDSAGNGWGGIYAIVLVDGAATLIGFTVSGTTNNATFSAKPDAAITLEWRGTVTDDFGEVAWRILNATGIDVGGGGFQTGVVHAPLPPGELIYRFIGRGTWHGIGVTVLADGVEKLQSFTGPFGRSFNGPMDQDIFTANPNANITLAWHCTSPYPEDFPCGYGDEVSWRILNATGFDVGGGGFQTGVVHATLPPGELIYRFVGHSIDYFMGCTALQEAGINLLRHENGNDWCTERYFKSGMGWQHNVVTVLVDGVEKLKSFTVNGRIKQDTFTATPNANITLAWHCTVEQVECYQVRNGISWDMQTAEGEQAGAGAGGEVDALFPTPGPTEVAYRFFARNTYPYTYPGNVWDIARVDILVGNTIAVSGFHPTNFVSSRTAGFVANKNASITLNWYLEPTLNLIYSIINYQHRIINASWVMEIADGVEVGAGGYSDAFIPHFSGAPTPGPTGNPTPGPDSTYTVRRVIDFEDLNFTDNQKYENGATFFDDTVGSPHEWTFTSSGATFASVYGIVNGTESWNGWAYSKDTDAHTPGFENQFSSVAGSGAAGSDNYAVFYEWGPYGNNITFSPGLNLTGSGIQVSNTAYAYYDMRNGSKFSSAFDTDDSFSVTVTGFNDTVETGSATITLADYTSDNTSAYYVSNSWNFLDLNGLGVVDKLRFTISVTDNGTPYYFAIDNIGAAPGPTGNSTAVPSPDPDDVSPCAVVNISCGGGACVALFENGSATVWGSQYFGGDIKETDSNRTVDLSANVVDISCGGSACVALFEDGHATAWGNQGQGGDLRDTDSNRGTINLSANVSDISCGRFACVALFENGSATAWGYKDWGGDLTEPDGRRVVDLSANAVDISCGGMACVALFEDGLATAWGDDAHGGYLSDVHPYISVDFKANVTHISCGGMACVARFENSSAIAWGNQGGGGDVTDTDNNRTVDLSANVIDISCGGSACVALFEGGHATAWGHQSYGGDLTDTDSNRVVNLSANVTDISCGGSACVARFENGSATAWGNQYAGGDLRDTDNDRGPVDLSANVTDISCGGSACVARFENGSATAWGSQGGGGGGDLTDTWDSNRGPVDLSVDVVDISCGENACVARFINGSATAWGSELFGGDLTGTDLSGQCPAPSTIQTPGPTGNPTPGPTGDPTPGPTGDPTPGPTGNPTPGPTGTPTPGPTGNPTPGPTGNPTPGPTGDPTPGPTGTPTPGPTGNPTLGPTGNPTPGPTGNPTPGPTGNPTPGPTGNPTPGPTGNPTAIPTGNPTSGPTSNPTAIPTGNPTAGPTGNPPPGPTGNPTGGPTSTPSAGSSEIQTLKLTITPTPAPPTYTGPYVSGSDFGSGCNLYEKGSSTLVTLFDFFGASSPPVTLGECAHACATNTGKDARVDVAFTVSSASSQSVTTTQTFESCTAFAWDNTGVCKDISPFYQKEDCKSDQGEITSVAFAIHTNMYQSIDVTAAWSVGKQSFYTMDPPTTTRLLTTGTCTGGWFSDSKGGGGMYYPFEATLAACVQYCADYSGGSIQVTFTGLPNPNFYYQQLDGHVNGSPCTTVSWNGTHCTDYTLLNIERTAYTSLGERCNKLTHATVKYKGVTSQWGTLNWDNTEPDPTSTAHIYQLNDVTLPTLQDPGDLSTNAPTASPTKMPTPGPTEIPTPVPSEPPTVVPTATPTPGPIPLSPSGSGITAATTPTTMAGSTTPPPGTLPGPSTLSPSGSGITPTTMSGSTNPPPSTFSVPSGNSTSGPHHAISDSKKTRMTVAVAGLLALLFVGFAVYIILRCNNKNAGNNNPDPESKIPFL